MAYDHIAAWYDALNTEADYDALARVVVEKLRIHGVKEGLVADLGCGTGELTLRLHRAGYEMIGIDLSVEMLSVFRDKLAESGEEVLLLCQNLAQLDLFGTIRAAVSSFDTFNHLPPDALKKVLERTALFLEPGGLLVFDVNTPYKHRHILANKHYTIDVADEPGVVCHWQNTTDDATGTTQICLALHQDGQTVAEERFAEYSHTGAFLEAQLQACGMAVLEVLDGERFGPLQSTSQRALYVAQKTDRLITVDWNE